MEIKKGKLAIYDVDNKYRDYLRRFDTKVSLKDNRRFYGIIVTKDNVDYCIPFTCKVKQRSLKLTINIKHKNKIIAQLLINNMIPVLDKVIKKVDINNDKHKQYLLDEMMYLKRKKVKEEILNKTENVFKVLKDNTQYDYKFFKYICCNFNLLTKQSKRYKIIKGE